MKLSLSPINEPYLHGYTSQRHATGKRVEIVRCYPNQWAVFICHNGKALSQLPPGDMPYPMARRMARVAWDTL